MHIVLTTGVLVHREDKQVYILLATALSVQSDPHFAAHASDHLQQRQGERPCEGPCGRPCEKRPMLSGERDGCIASVWTFGTVPSRHRHATVLHTLHALHVRRLAPACWPTRVLTRTQARMTRMQQLYC